MTPPKNTTCSEEALLFFLHGELRLAARLRLQLHLLGCPACRERLQSYRRLTARLALGMAQPDHPPRFSLHTSPPPPLWVIAGLSLLILGATFSVLRQWRTLFPPRLPLAASAQETEEDCHPAESQRPRLPSAPHRKKP